MSKRCLGCMEMFGDEFDLCPHCGFVVGTPAEEAIHINPGTLLRDRYIIGKVLGYGGFGVTYIAWDKKLEQIVAVKEYLPGEFSTRMPGQSDVTIFSGDKKDQFNDGLKKFIDEAKRLAKFQNEPGIVKILDSFEENSTAYIIMEYLKGETLTEYLKRENTIPAEKAVSMLMPIMDSLKNLHSNGLLHRDIAPDNIFLTEKGEVKLIDFGASRYATTSHSRSLTVLVKPGFSPEEQYRSRGDQGPHTDVYAVAATLYKMITGKNPPDAMERRAKYENDNKDILIPPHKLTKNITQSVDVALLNALNVRIEDRTPDISSFIKELESDPPAKRRYGKIKQIDVYMWPLWLKILIPSLLTVALIFSGLLLTNVINFSKFTDKIVLPDNFVVVPDVEGFSTDDAIKEIEANNLLAMALGTVESDYIEAGKIVLQDPVGGSFKKVNSGIMLTVSSGTEVKEAENGISVVPYVIWDSKEDALAKLEKAGLGAPKITEVTDENVEAGHVISQSIDANTEVEEGTVIELVISLGPSELEIPDLDGKSIEEAEEILSSMGLSVAVEYTNDNSAKEGSVISQSSTGEAKRGDEIVLKVASNDELIKVDDVTGKDKKDAESILTSKGFRVNIIETEDNNTSIGCVISQDPKAGSSQKKGDTITLAVCSGTKKLTISFYSGCDQTFGNKTVQYKKTYGDLPTPSREGYKFLGWYSELYGGSQITQSTTVSNENPHTLYAHWEKNAAVTTPKPAVTTPKPVVTTPKPAVTEKSEYRISKAIYVDGELRGMDTNKPAVSYGEEYTVKTTPIDSYTFQGWELVHGEETIKFIPVTAERTVYKSGSKEIDYYYYTEKFEYDYHIGVKQCFTPKASSWTDVSQIPSNAEIQQTRWVYDLVTSKWEETESGTRYYANFPDGFDTDSDLYKKYEKGPASSSETETSKITYSDPVHDSYIYWHWNYVLGTPGPLDDRITGSYKDEVVNAINGVYSPNTCSVFSAFEDATDLGHTDSHGKTVEAAYFKDTGNWDHVSWWWKRCDVYVQKYTVSKLTTATTKQQTSDTEIKEGESINGGKAENVKKQVKYILK